MAISLIDNLKIQNKKQNVERDSFVSIADMVAYSPNYLPNLFHTMCEETGKMYVYNVNNDIDPVLGKWREYGSGVGTDETVKLTSTSTDAKYLNELIDNSTIEVDVNNDCLVVKKIDGQTATVAEINFLTGVTANVQEQINNLSKSMTMYGVFDTKADLLASVDPVPVDGNTAIVVADEDNNNKQMTYIYIASNSAWTQVAESSVTVRDFTTNPIQLDTETIGTLSKDKIDTAIARLADVLDKATYVGSADGIVKQADMLTGLTYTITALNEAIKDSHTHTNKTALDKIVSNGLGSNFLADNGKYISVLSVGVSEPAYTSQIWIDNTDTSKPKLKIYDGTDWIVVTGTSNSGCQVYIGNTEPTDKDIELWINPDETSGGGTGGSGTAEDTTYTNENFPQYDNVDLALDALFNKVYYVKPTCSLSADKKGGTFEMGTIISAPITFTWTTNKDITSQTLTGCTLADASVRTATYNTNVTADKSFTLSVSDGENSASSSVSYKFMNNVFWGSASTGIYNSAFINALSNKKLASAIKGTYSFNIASGEYGFWAVPSNMTISSVWIGGFEVTVDDLGIVSYTNAQGYTRDYRIYKTGKSGLGSITAEIK